jgi:hypothetical protein
VPCPHERSLVGRGDCDMPITMSSDKSDAGDARAMLHLPEKFDLPEPEVIVQDARAILLHAFSLRKELGEADIVISPVWEDHGGQASVRAAIVPPEIVKRYFEGPGLTSLRDAGVMQMLGDVVGMLLEDPEGAAKVLAATEQLWVSPQAPVRSLDLPYKPHFKVLTLAIADLARKVGAGFTELEWIASLGLLDAYHDPANDPPREEVLTATAAKTLAMCAEEASWMRTLAQSQSNHD